jgi:hypothetical protein
MRRPFYPANSRLSPRRDHILTGLDIDNFDHLSRLCELKSESRRAACPIFWTLGANQVGKAAIDGWQSVVRPALVRGAKLWPFEGSLAELSEQAACVICETYPQEAYAHVGFRLQSSSGGKRSQSGRKAVAQQILTYVATQKIALSETLKVAVESGFGPSASDEDQFDALVGLLSMIRIVQGHHHEGGSKHEPWEGWILGQSM